MSGFSAEWLSLREPADHQARNAELLNNVAEALKGREPLSVTDLAAGTGSNLRACAAHFGPWQCWRLVDSDAGLLRSARARLTAWADEILCEEPLVLKKSGQRIEVEFALIDLSADLVRALEGPSHLITAAAFFDLVSVAWMENFCAEVAQRGLPCYATLIYTGEETWLPPSVADKAMRLAFLRHQARDKGFGPAAGPSAARHLTKAFEARGYRVMARPSPWLLGGDDGTLMAALASGIADAVGETGLADEATMSTWRDARARASACIIGHMDVFASPSGG